MKILRIRMTLGGVLLAVACLIASAALPALAQDKVKVGVFPISSSLPLFVARDLGYFKELNIEPELSTLMGGPPNVAALITNQIKWSSSWCAPALPIRSRPWPTSRD
jgi:NitT/TauT family transport system substrate-binding protein